MKTLIIDNGAYEVKLNWADSENCMHVQNAMMRSRDRRLWLANAVDLCKDLIGLQYRRPIERGQLYSWELEKPIWDWIWDTKKITDDVDEFKECNLVLSETCGTLPACSGNTDQIIFEEYEFANFRRCPPQTLASNLFGTAEAKLVVDLGFYATHVVPVMYRTKVCQQGIKRLDVGGKMLTNYLKETVSYRYYNMMEDTAILNKVKEAACFSSLNFEADLKKWHTQETTQKFTDFALCYALPSNHDDPYGHLEPDLKRAIELQRSGKEQILVLENERFSIPEALFDPIGHVGIEQAPLPEVISQSINACPPEYHELLWSNIVVCGGTANMPNIINRIENELRQWAPSNVPVNVFSVEGDKSETAFKGARTLVNDDDFDVNGWTVSRDEYLEQGPAYTAKRMGMTNRLTELKK